MNADPFQMLRYSSLLFTTNRILFSLFEALETKLRSGVTDCKGIIIPVSHSPDYEMIRAALWSISGMHVIVSEPDQYGMFLVGLQNHTTVDELASHFLINFVKDMYFVFRRSEITIPFNAQTIMCLALNNECWKHVSITPFEFAQEWVKQEWKICMQLVRDDEKKEFRIKLANYVPPRRVRSIPWSNDPYKVSEEDEKRVTVEDMKNIPMFEQVFVVPQSF
jgi:hypothetical protein